MEKKFIVTGMTCAACAAHVERAVKKLDVERVEVNLLSGKMTVVSDKPDADIIRAVEAAGYGARAEGGHSPAEQKPVDYSRTLFVRFLCSIAFLLPLMYFSMGHMGAFPMGPLDPHTDPSSFALIQLVLATPVLIINARFFVSGAKALLHRAPSMDTLVSIGSGASYLYGVVMLFAVNGRVASGDIYGGAELATGLFFESSAMILALVTLGKFLEAKSKGKTRSEVDKLLRLRPQTATVLRDGQEVVIPAEEIAVGDVVIVRSGEYVPCDGVIISGATTLDKSAITGESIPEEATVGDRVTSASLNLTGRVEVRAQRVGADSTLSKIIELIENAGGSKAPIQNIADKVSAVFVPAVCGIGLVTLIVWLAIGGVGRALTMAISVLVISCPCALGLATPVAIMAGTGRAAAYGVLVKNAEVLQSLGGAQIVALDKTATITEGKPKVTEVKAFGALAGREADVLEIAAALEKTSTHPLAKAIADSANGKLSAERSEYRIGYGVVGVVNGVEYALGGEKLMAERGVAVEEESAQTVYLCADGALLGSITVEDGVKPTSARAVELLTAAGVRTVMITGDNQKQAQKIASRVGITEVYSNVLPQDKLDIIQKLKAQGKTAMVGDGINDAPALKAADIGIAIGSGTDVAIEAADVVLVKSDLTDVPRAMAVSAHTLRNVKQNLFWAFIYNTLGIPLAAGALYTLGITLNPMIAAACMAFSSLFVVCNALRLTVMRFDDAKLSKKLTKKRRACAAAPTDEQKGEVDMEKTFAIKGMMCMHCVGHVQKAIQGVPGVTKAEVSLENGEATVSGEFDSALIVAAVTDAGYECEQKA